MVISSCLYTLPCVSNAMFHRCTLAITVRHRKNRTWFVIFEMLSKFWVCMSVAMFDEAAKQMQVLVGVYLIYFTVICTSLPYRFLRHSMCDICFCFDKLVVCYMSSSFLDGNAADGLPILFLVFCVYVIFAGFFLSSVYFFFKGRAADPNYDRDILIAIRTRLLKGWLPMQNDITDLVPGMDSNSARWSKANEGANASAGTQALNATVVDLETKNSVWKATLQRKNALAEQDCKLISEKIVPSKLSATFQSLVASQRAVVSNYENDEKGDLQSMMEEQSKLLKDLLVG